jgi:peptidylamidoglycolate lyase
VAPLNDGSFIVADGYCNNRAVRYNADGSFHSQYDLPPPADAADGVGYGVVHSLVVDECDGRLMLAERERFMVHSFDLHTGQLTGAATVAAGRV